MKNEKVLLGALGVAAAGLAAIAIKIVKGPKEDVEQEQPLTIDVDDLFNE